MRKILLAGILVVCAFLIPSGSPANPLDIPTGGSWIPPPLTATANGYFVGRSTFTIALTTPTVGYQYCISHVVVTSTGPVMFEMGWSTGSYSNPGTPGTTDYVVLVGTTTPYDTQWAYKTPYCAPINDQLNLFTVPVGSTVTYEGYTFKGWN